jgi:hypothetical protein
MITYLVMLLITHPLPTDLLITYPDSVLFGLIPTVQICWHVVTLTYDKKHTASLQLHTSRASAFGKGHQTNIPRRTLTRATMSDVDCADSSHFRYGTEERRLFEVL